MKNQDIVALSAQELTEKVKEQKDALNKMKINHKISPVENPMTIRTARKTVARLLTEASKRKKASK
ncbi:MAG: 50S ribosomal protein L29 [Bacteroidia bacterium]